MIAIMWLVWAGEGKLGLNQNLPRTRTRRDWPFSYFSRIANVYWVLGTKSCTLRRRCEPVVFSPAVSISSTLKLHMKICKVQLFQSWLSSVLRVFTVQNATSQYEVGLLHYSDTFVVSMIRLYDDAIQASKITSDSNTQVYTEKL